MKTKTFAVLLLLFLLLWPLADRRVYGQGLAFSGIGPINASMGGAATAAPIDSSGALMWNPATISGLETSEISFGITLAMPSSDLGSLLPAGTFGPGLPPITMMGEDGSEPGVSPVPNIGYVERSDGSPWTFGLGVFGIGGFRTNYSSSLTNPVLTPAPPAGFGAGRISAEADLVQILPTASYALSDQLSVGFAPSLTLARLSAESLIFAAPNDANGDGFPTYPSGRGNRVQFGGGFQVGVYYITERYWHFGAALKSPQWFEPFRFKTEDELGRPRTEKITVEYPLIATVGTAYSGFERFVFAADARFFDYGHAAGFQGSGLDANGALTGLGWSSIFAASAGVQYKVCEPFFIRCGYSYNQNPISEADIGFNIASPVITQHFSFVGASLRVSEHTIFSTTYIHGFENEVSGPIQSMYGPVPGSSVYSAVSLDALAMGITVQY
ncbi:MAG: OmpP1/FadL family transporter [Pirellulaceae bacterium]